MTLTNKNQYENLLQSYAKGFHVYTAILAAFLFVAWNYFDYLLLPDLWKNFLIYRIIGSFCIVVSLILYFFKKVSHLFTLFVAGIVANHGGGWMMAYVDEPNLSYYFIGYSVSIIVTSMMIFCRLRIYLTLVISTIAIVFYGFLIQQGYSFEFFMMKGGFAWITLTLFSVILFYFKMQLIYQNLALMTQVETQNKELEKYANTDSLTQIFNRRYLDKTFKEIKEGDEDFCVLFCDLNGLKRINDLYGHDAGDQYIVAYSKVLKKVTRSTDFLFRTGGDEFVVICPGSTKEQIETHLIPRIKRSCEQLSFSFVDKKSGQAATEEMHMSIGVSSSKECDKELLIKIADERMQHEKDLWYSQQGKQKYR